MHKPVTYAAGIMLLLTLLLQGCGHKGPLFMPQPPAAAPQSNQNK
jgi:predicted small lipoprotein YifL